MNEYLIIVISDALFLYLLKENTFWYSAKLTLIDTCNVNEHVFKKRLLVH